MTIEARQAGETAKEYAYRIIKENIITLELEPGSTLNDMETVSYTHLLIGRGITHYEHGG